MSRPYKRTLDRFILPIDFARDLRVRFLLRNHGSQALAVYVAVLCMVYANGYYCTLDDDLVDDIADQLAEAKDYVRKVIDSATAIGIFDEELATKEHILTSKSVQENYLRLVERRRGLKIEEYALVDSPREELPTPKRDNGAAGKPYRPSQNKIYEDMCSSPLWGEAMMREHHINKMQLAIYLDEFKNHCQCIDHIHEDTRDAKQHFNNWLRIRLKNNNNGTNKQSGTQADGRQQRAADYAATIASLAAQDDSRNPKVRHA
jgi:hypothetical protein